MIKLLLDELPQPMCPKFSKIREDLLGEGDKFKDSIPICTSEEVCNTIQKLFTNSWDPELSIIASNLVFDKYDRPTMQLEIKISNCRTMEDVKKIKDKLSEAIRDAVNLINDYGC